MGLPVVLLAARSGMAIMGVRRGRKLLVVFVDFLLGLVIFRVRVKMFILVDFCSKTTVLNTLVICKLRCKLMVFFLRFFRFGLVL